MRRNGGMAIGAAAWVVLGAVASGCAEPDAVWLDQLVDRSPGYGVGAALDEGVLRGDGLVMLGADVPTDLDGYRLESSDPAVIDLATRADVSADAEFDDGLGPDAPAVWLDTPNDPDADEDPSLVVVLRTGQAGDAVVSLIDPDGVTIDTIPVSVAAPGRVALAPGGAAWWRGLDDFAPRTLAGEDYSYDVVSFDAAGAPLRGMGRDVRRFTVPHPNRAVGPDPGEQLGSSAVGVHEAVFDGMRVQYEVVDPSDIVELGFRAAELRAPHAEAGVDVGSSGLLVVGVDRSGRDVLGIPATWGGQKDSGDLYAYTADAGGALRSVDAAWGGLSIADAVRQSGEAGVGHSDQPPGCDTSGGAARWTGLLAAVTALAAARRPRGQSANTRSNPTATNAAISWRVSDADGQ